MQTLRKILPAALVASITVAAVFISTQLFARDRSGKGISVVGHVLVERGRQNGDLSLHKGFVYLGDWDYREKGT